jgi:hypothetical protein
MSEPEGRRVDWTEERAQRPRERSEQMDTGHSEQASEASEHVTREAGASGRPEAEREAL